MSTTPSPTLASTPSSPSSPSSSPAKRGPAIAPISTKGVSDVTHSTRLVTHLTLPSPALSLISTPPPPSPRASSSSTPRPRYITPRSSSGAHTDSNLCRTTHAEPTPGASARGEFVMLRDDDDSNLEPRC
jgi:hypothetical protein